jgi:copper(I)-binding protein
LSRRKGARFATVSLFAAASLIGVVALSSCGSGTDALTGLARTTTNTAAGAKGTISLRNVYVAGPAKRGESAQVISAFYNGGAEEDRIIVVSSPAAGAGQLPASPLLNPGSLNIYIADGTAPTLVGLKTDLEIGASIPITFTFAKAGAITLQVPVQRPAPGASKSPEPGAEVSLPPGASPTGQAATPVPSPTSPGGSATPTQQAAPSSTVTPSSTITPSSTVVPTP